MRWPRQKVDGGQVATLRLLVFLQACTGSHEHRLSHAVPCRKLSFRLPNVTLVTRSGNLVPHVHTSSSLGGVCDQKTEQVAEPLSLPTTFRLGRLHTLDLIALSVVHVCWFLRGQPAGCRAPPCQGGQGGPGPWPGQFVPLPRSPPLCRLTPPTPRHTTHSQPLVSG